jgi:hypothetical protein
MRPNNGMHLTPLRGPRSVAFCDVISCRPSFQSIDAAQVMPRAFGGRCNVVDRLYLLISLARS